MTVRSLDGGGSKAVLIAASEYDDDRLPNIPAASNSLTLMYQVLTDDQFGKWNPEDVQRFLNPRNSGKLSARLSDLLRDVFDTVLVYFVGHGTLDDSGELCLTISDTESEHVGFTGLTYAWVRTILKSSPAKTKIVIIDSCYSGRAIAGLSSNKPASLADLTGVEGVYTLTAADTIAHAGSLSDQDPGSGTTFTNELVKIVSSGVPGGPREISLGLLYQRLDLRMRNLGMPRPNQRGTDRVADFPFARNVAFATLRLRLEPRFDEYLSESATDVDVQLSMSISEMTTQLVESALVLVIDGHLFSSAELNRRDFRPTVARVIESIPDGVSFAVIIGERYGRFAYPANPSLADSHLASRRDAVTATMAVLSDGSGRYIASWLSLAETLFQTTTASTKRAMILFDGSFDDSPDELTRVVTRCANDFVCDLFGCGIDWRVEQARGVAVGLNGITDIIADPDTLGSVVRMVSDVNKGTPRIGLTIRKQQETVISEAIQSRPDVFELQGEEILKDFVVYPLGTLEREREFAFRLKVPSRFVQGGIVILRAQSLPPFADDSVLDEVEVKVVRTSSVFDNSSLPEYMLDKTRLGRTVPALQHREKRIPDECPSCGALFKRPSDRFCEECGYDSRDL